MKIAINWKAEAPANYLLNICDSTVDEKCSKTIENMSFLILKNHRLFDFVVQKWLNFRNEIMDFGSQCTKLLNAIER